MKIEWPWKSFWDCLGDMNTVPQMFIWWFITKQIKVIKPQYREFSFLAFSMKIFWLFVAVQSRNSRLVSFETYRIYYMIRTNIIWGIHYLNNHRKWVFTEVILFSIMKLYQILEFLAIMFVTMDLTLILEKQKACVKMD